MAAREHKGHKRGKIMRRKRVGSPKRWAQGVDRR
jgi:hypothetical protein